MVCTTTYYFNPLEGVVYYPYGETKREAERESNVAPRYEERVDESTGTIHLEVELPGVKREDVSVEVRNYGKNLEIAARRARPGHNAEAQREGKISEEVVDGVAKPKTPEEDKSRNAGYVQLLRSFKLPRTADANKLQAKLLDGILYVDIPRAEEAAPRKIELQ
eukprot:CAMPEP_0198322028 /NCGR_PEP_ID=MMETSP1450-20131203/10603_1 /TAXON_ID=753684 ORGANISM="Madagascaria erythrocladiodes, Strain CCMP3234" /NCGR_SAMPLE_ID=MMETSP1450 /ASSEMBLY_ACC=CAM_ASM_001115 /LENGTH=163 /DNA_ID=CAMNT_0044025619 /DNA_START=265 /DNA_END=756 /DNA_ORIENTATION=+